MTSLPSTRTQIAQRMRRELAREIEHVIDAERLLTDALYARDVLLVCDALHGTELATLSALFREATALVPLSDQDGDPGHAPQSNDWAGDTSGFGLSSGFGVTQPPPLGEPALPAPRPLAERRRAWLGRWRRE